MLNQNLFNALADICNFSATEDEMILIINAVEKDKEEYQQQKCANWNLLSDNKCILGTQCKCAF